MQWRAGKQETEGQESAGLETAGQESRAVEQGKTTLRKHDVFSLLRIVRESKYTVFTSRGSKRR